MRLPGRDRTADVEPREGDHPDIPVRPARRAGRRPSDDLAGTEMAVGSAASAGSQATEAATKRPLYPRLLGLRHIGPNAWQRALLGEGALALAVLLVLADVATAWTLLVLPLTVALVVKAHDGLAGLLRTRNRAGQPPEL